MSERIGDWFQTIKGRVFYPLDPRVEDFDIEEIAHALAHLCRFNGHMKSFYSVAQHSVLVSLHVPKEDALEGLLHDATEAYLGDMIRPLKRAVPEYRKVEAWMERVLAMRFGLRHPWPDSVKIADNRVLLAERRDLLAPPPIPWRETVEPILETINPRSPEEARRIFLHRYRELGAPT